MPTMTEIRIRRWQADGRGRVRGDVIEHRPLRRDRDAEIAMEEPLQENQITLPERQIEAVFRAPERDEFLVRGREIAELREHRIAGNGVGDQKNDERCEQRHHRRNWQGA